MVNNSLDSSDGEPIALIMKGGGIKGLAYVGALEELTKYYDFNWYAGTSAGAISAVLLAAGYSNEELKVILHEKDFSDFKDASVVRRIYNLITKIGLYEAKTFTQWLDNLLAKKLNSPVEIYLKDLPNRVTIYASKRGEEALIFDSEDPGRKDQRAAYAARCSMSIPIFFTPQKDQGLNVFDGGSQNNYPVEILLRNNPGTDFIGLYLGPEHFEGHKKKSIFKELISIWTESIDVVALRKHQDKTVIIDPRPISTTDFSLDDEQKEFLLECGRMGALKFLSKKKENDINQVDIDNRVGILESKRAELERKVRRKKFIKSIKIWIISIFISAIIVLLISLIPRETTGIKGNDNDNNSVIIGNDNKIE